MVSKFKEGDRVYCTHTDEWGEVLEFLGEGLVRIQLEGYEPCLRLSHDLTKKPSHKSDREVENLPIQQSNLGAFVQPSLLKLIKNKSSKFKKNRSTERSRRSPSGSLYKFLQNKRNKAGQVLTYPKVEGERDPNCDRHWFWAYCYDEKTEDGWKSRKRSVSVEKLAIVRKAIADNKPIEEVLKLIK